MSSVPASNAPPPPRKSFAQVAAAANVSIAPKEKPTNKPNDTRNAQISAHPASSLPSARVVQDPKALANGATPDSDAVDAIHLKNNEVPQLPALLQRIQLQDDRPSMVIPELIARREPDTKSVASRTTITLDEKESLRPDDSASVQAAPEEDVFSPSGSIAAESRDSGDADAKAFREQLNAIDRTGAAVSATKQLPVVLPRTSLAVRTAPILPPPVPVISTIVNALSINVPGTPAVILDTFVVPPDEKLLEALASPKDRLFVLKIEQDMIDFVKDPKEEFLQLPQTNSFYRMLSHKLADYYMLGHVVDESLTSVRIHRTPQTRLPLPLIGPVSTVDGSTPPPTAPTRKIMRRMLERDLYAGQRGGETFDSHNSSKAPSDTADGSGGDDANEDGTKGKDKATLTREERENRYKEARARIFKDFKEEPVESAEANDKEVSRSSSASGVKKSKKPKKLKDDGFEARSAYSQYGTQTFQATAVTSPASDNSFYNPFAPYALGNFSGQAPRPQESPLQASTPGFPPYGNQTYPAYGTWAQPLQSPGYTVPQTQNGTYYGTQNGYDPSSMYGSPIQSFTPSNMASSLTPKVSHPTPSYSTEFLGPSDQFMWGPGFNNAYMPNGMMYNPVNSGMTTPGLVPGQMMYSPTGAFDGGMNSNGQFFPMPQHPSFDRQQQFNPRTQAFVPSLRNPMAGSLQSNTSSPYMNTTPRPANNTPSQRQIPTVSQPSGNGVLPHAAQHSPTSARTNGHSPYTGPAPNSFSSTISKWGNSSTLPPKPPPPALPRDVSLPPNPYSNAARVAIGGDTPSQAAH